MQISRLSLGSRILIGMHAYLWTLVLPLLAGQHSPVWMLATADILMTSAQCACRTLRSMTGFCWERPVRRAAAPPRADSGPAVQRVVLRQGNRLFDESKIFVEQFLGLRAGRDRSSAIHRRHCKL